MLCLRAERAMLDALDGTCHTPIAGLARLEGAEMHLTGLAAWPDGRDLTRLSHTGPATDPESLGQAVGTELRMRMGSDFFAALGD